MPALFTGADAIALSVAYSDGLTELERRDADMRGGVQLSDGGLVAVANLAGELALASAGLNPDGSAIGDSASLTEPTIDGKPVDPIVNVLAMAVEQLAQIAVNTGHVDVHVPIETVLEQWEKAGMRINEDLAVAFVESLPGVVVDK